MSNEILHKKIVKHFNTIFSEAPPEVPDYVADNLGVSPPLPTKPPLRIFTN